MSLSPRKRFILSATAGYFVFGCAWIFLSDRLLLSFTDVDAATRLSTAKGVTFVAITALLLLLALLVVPSRSQQAGQECFDGQLLAGASDNLPRWIPYGFAAVVSLAMLALRMQVAVSFNDRPLLILFMLPVILSSVLGGFGPGALATVIAGAGTAYFCIPPVYQLRIGQPHDLLQWCMLIGTGLLASYLSELLHRARRQAENRRLALQQSQEEVHQLNAALEQRIQERTAELTAANGELESFAYAVSHDLRAPLRAMGGFSQALIEDFGETLNGEAKVYLDQIIAGSKQMNELIDGLLKLSRSTRGQLQREAVNLSGLCTAILDELSREHPERQVELQIEASLIVRGDPVMLGLVMRNLLANAWKYTAKTQHAVIRLYAKVEDSRRWICLADNGAGFDMAHAGKLFQPFQRLHRQDEFPGIGIGLATVQRIVNRHGGSIRAEGAVNQGATFFLYLP